MDSANTANQHSDSALNQKRRNCLNITVFFQWDKYNGNVIETNKIFPLRVFYVLLFQYLLQSLLFLCFTCLLSKDVWLPTSLSGRLTHSMNLLHSPLCTFAFFLTPLLRKLLFAACTILRNSTGFIQWFDTERCWQHCR